MNTIILTLQSTSKTADPVKKTGILTNKNQIKKNIFKTKNQDMHLFYYSNSATINNRELL